MTVKEKMKDIYLDLDIRRFAERYFDKSGSWLYHKFDRENIDSEGKKEDFTPEQLQTLKMGLLDFADRIRQTADKL